jgi:hypothetical protein
VSSRDLQCESHTPRRQLLPQESKRQHRRCRTQQQTDRVCIHELAIMEKATSKRSNRDQTEIKAWAYDPWAPSSPTQPNTRKLNCKVVSGHVLQGAKHGTGRKASCTRHKSGTSRMWHPSSLVRLAVCARFSCTCGVRHLGLGSQTPATQSSMNLRHMAQSDANYRARARKRSPPTQCNNSLGRDKSVK